tara:strand:+ start:1569 stop:4715 length:3147 start_codon:yes stop_codon:yes gene_type:complete
MEPDDTIEEPDYTIGESITKAKCLTSESKFCDDSLYANYNLIIDNKTSVYFSDKQKDDNKKYYLYHSIAYFDAIMKHIFEVQPIQQENCADLPKEEKVNKKELEDYLERKLNDYISCSCKDVNRGNKCKAAFWKHNLKPDHWDVVKSYKKQKKEPFIEFDKDFCEFVRELSLNNKKIEKIIVKESKEYKAVYINSGFKKKLLDEHILVKEDILYHFNYDKLLELTNKWYADMVSGGDDLPIKDLKHLGDKVIYFFGTDGFGKEPDTDEKEKWDEDWLDNNLEGEEVKDWIDNKLSNIEDGLNEGKLYNTMNDELDYYPVPYYQIWKLCIKKLRKLCNTDTDIEELKKEINSHVGIRHHKQLLIENYVSIYKVFQSDSDEACVSKNIFKNFKIQYNFPKNTIRNFIPGVDRQKIKENTRPSEKISIATGIKYTEIDATTFDSKMDGDHLLPYLFCLLFNVLHEEETIILLEKKINNTKDDAIPQINSEDGQRIIDSKFVCVMDEDSEKPTTKWKINGKELDELENWLNYYDEYIKTNSVDAMDICREAMEINQKFEPERAESGFRDPDYDPLNNSDSEEEDDDVQDMEQIPDTDSPSKKIAEINFYKRNFEGFDKEKMPSISYIKNIAKLNSTGKNNALFYTGNDKLQLTQDERKEAYIECLRTIESKIIKNNKDRIDNIIEAADKRRKILYNFFNNKYFLYLDEIESMFRINKNGILEHYGNKRISNQSNRLKKAPKSYTLFEFFDKYSKLTPAVIGAIKDDVTKNFPEDIVVIPQKGYDDLIESTYRDTWDCIQLIILHELDELIHKDYEIKAITKQIDYLRKREVKVDKDNKSSLRLEAILDYWKKWKEFQRKKDEFSPDNSKENRRKLLKDWNESDLEQKLDEYHFELQQELITEEEYSKDIEDFIKEEGKKSEATFEKRLDRSFKEKELEHLKPKRPRPPRNTHPLPRRGQRPAPAPVPAPVPAPAPAAPAAPAPAPVDLMDRLAEITAINRPDLRARARPPSEQPKSKRPRTTTGGKKLTRRRVKKSSKKKLGYKLINTRKQK